MTQKEETQQTEVTEQTQPPEKTSQNQPSNENTLTNVREYTLPSGCTQIRCGICWDFIDKPVDLDMSAMVFDEMSFEQDVAFYNNTKILNNSVIHSGDVRDGKETGDDEYIDINLLSLLNSNSKSIYFLVNVYNGGNFSDVETGYVSLYINGNKCYNYALGMSNNTLTAFVVGCLFYEKDVNNNIIWQFTMIEKMGKGINFDQSRPLVEKYLSLVYDEVLIMERPNNPRTTYNLEKGDIYTFDTSVNSCSVGLGWDENYSKRIDVDGSLILIDNNFHHVQDVNFSEQSFRNGIVQHSGDNLTGKGEGDDETIYVNLKQMPSHISYIAIVVNIYSGASSFNAIENCYVRLVDENKKVLCYFNLSENDDQYTLNGMFMGYLYKISNDSYITWKFTPVGEDGQGTMSKDMRGQCINTIQFKHKNDIKNLKDPSPSKEIMGVSQNDNKNTDTQKLLNNNETEESLSKSVSPIVPPPKNQCCLVM